MSQRSLKAVTRMREVAQHASEQSESIYFKRQTNQNTSTNRSKGICQPHALPGPAVHQQTPEANQNQTTTQQQQRNPHKGASSPSAWRWTVFKGRSARRALVCPLMLMILHLQHKETKVTDTTA